MLVTRTFGDDEEDKRPEPAASGSRVLARVDPERCSGCGICLDVCPEQAISLADIASVDPDRCTACGECVVECPFDALSLGLAAEAAPAARDAVG